MNVVPQVLPNLLLGRARVVNEVAANFDVGAIDDGEPRADFLDQGNETRHLRVI